MTNSRLFSAIVLVFVALIFLTGCNASLTFGEGVTGSGELVTESYDLDDFDSLEVRTSFDVLVTVGDATLVEVTVDDNLVEDLDVRVRNGELQIGLRSGVSVNNATLEATVQLPDLAALDISGSSRVDVVGDLTSELEIDVSGSSDLTMTGAAQAVTIDSSGASNIDLLLTGVDPAEVDLSGASSVELLSARTVEGDMSGASDLVVPESATLDISTSGAATISRN